MYSNPKKWRRVAGLVGEVFIAFEKADKTMVLRNACASSIIALLEEDKNVTSGIRILNLKAI